MPLEFDYAIRTKQSKFHIRPFEQQKHLKQNPTNFEFAMNANCVMQYLHSFEPSNK